MRLGCADRGLRHRSVAGLVRVLHDRQASVPLDRGEPLGPVAQGSGEDHADDVGGESLRRRAEERVDRRPVAVLALRLPKPDNAALHDEMVVRRRDHDAPGLDLLAVLGVRGGIRAGAVEDLRQRAPARGNVKNDQQRERQIRRQRVDEALQRLDATGRGADDYDQVVRPVFFSVGVHAPSPSLTQIEYRTTKGRRSALLSGRNRVAYGFVGGTAFASETLFASDAEIGAPAARAALIAAFAASTAWWTWARPAWNVERICCSACFSACLSAFVPAFAARAAWKSVCNCCQSACITVCFAWKSDFSCCQSAWIAALAWSF